MFVYAFIQISAFQTFIAIATDRPHHGLRRRGQMLFKRHVKTRVPGNVQFECEDRSS